MPVQRRESNWSEYFRYVRACGLASAILLSISVLAALTSVPVGSLMRRAAVVVPLYVISAFVLAGFVFLVPRLWFWPWMRARKKRS
jgi:hypothetical protein